MRLTDDEKAAIKQAIRGLDPSARVYLFGSRADDSLKGGDIDLLVVSDKIGFSEKILALTQIKDQIGEQKIDLLIKASDAMRTDPFVASILTSAIEL